MSLQESVMDAIKTAMNVKKAIGEKTATALTALRSIKSA